MLAALADLLDVPLSFRSPSQMIDAEDGLLIGLEADLVVDERKLGRQLIEIPAFNSRSNLSKFCAGRGAIFSGTNTQAGVVSLLLSRSAIKGKRVIYIVRKEGLDIVQDPTVKGMMGCAEQASTPFMLKSAWTGSASVPLILDEYKPSEIGPRRHDLLLQHFRMLYNQGTGASGGINRGGSDTSFRDITTFTYSAPTAFLGETQEMQTAVVQRSLPVAFNKADSERNTKHFEIASMGADMMPRLGRVLLAMSLNETVESRIAALEPIRTHLRSVFDKSIHDRQVYNLAVVMAGVEYLGRALSEMFGSEFDGRMERLKCAIFDRKADISVSAVSEASKCLKDMRLKSCTEPPDSEFAMRQSYEYIVGDSIIEIRLREAFVKYFSVVQE